MLIMSSYKKIISNKYSTENEEADLFLHWFMDISTRNTVYKEPLFDADTTKLFKQICDSLEQDSHVFILAIEVAESYVRLKKQKNKKIRNPLLVAITITFLCHKCQGALESLKVKHVIDLMFYFTHKTYSPNEIIAVEGDIIVTLGGNLPITTPLDDLDVIIERYMPSNHLKVGIRNLCIKILEIVYIEKRKWFSELKELYSQNIECVNVFKYLVTCKFYVPVSILIAAIQVTHYHNVLDTGLVLADINKYMKIHENHIQLLVAQFMQLISFI